ncbi:MAG: DMT family transporter [Bacteroidia bacterium]|nr:DMT family transporter [Bacteroidia bacterium]
MKTNKPRVYFLVVLSMVIWGLSYVWVKKVYEFYTPVTTVFLRIFIATLFLLGISLALGKFQKIKKADIRIFLLLGLFDPFGFFLFEGLGLKYSSPTVSAVIISMIPLFLPVATFLALRERLTALNILGLLISFIGVLLVIIKDDLTLATSLLGLLMLFIAVAFSVTSNIMIKKLSAHYTIYTIITWLDIISVLYFIPLFFIFEFNDFIKVPVTASLLVPLLCLAFFASGLAFLFYLKGLTEIGVAKTNIFVNIIPVFAAIFSYFFLGEILTVRIISGIGVVIAGLLVSQSKELLNYKW